MSQFNVLPGISPDTYTPHHLHTNEYAWVEKNCYIDLYIEVLHGLRMEPLAMLPFTLAVDFVGDQWTFFKPQLSEMRELYGLDVQEMSVWRSLLEHCAEHLGSGRLVSVEVDAYWLPDTIAADYRKQHTKTTIAIVKLDTNNQVLGYFHNAGYFELGGEDFRRIFHIGFPLPEDYLNPYVELIHINRLVQHTSEKLFSMSYDLLRKYLQLIPDLNPIHLYSERFKRELPILQERGLEYYHLWAFNNTRQLGAAFELAALYLEWLSRSGQHDFAPAIANFQKISMNNKSLILKIARLVSTKKHLDLSEMFEGMAYNWEESMRLLKKAVN
jgi:hypothetical protein